MAERLDAREGRPHGRLERLERGVGPLGQLVVLDGAEQTLEVIELGALGGQVVEVDALCAQPWQRSAHEPIPVKTGVVEHDHSPLAWDGQLLQAAHHVDGVEVPPGW